MSKKFAKLFETEKGQIVVILKANDDDDCPELRFFTMPDGNYDVCSLAFGYPDSDAGWEKATKAFEECDEALAMRVLNSTQNAVEG